MLKRGRKLFKKSFSSPHPIFQKLWNWGLIFRHNSCVQPLNAKCSHCTQVGKFWSSFFKSLRVWAAPIKNGVFFLPSFFFAPLAPKKKRDNGILCFFRRGRKLFKKSFSSPYPIFQKLWNWGLIFCHNFCARRSNAQCSHRTKAWKFLVRYCKNSMPSGTKVKIFISLRTILGVGTADFFQKGSKNTRL